MGGIYLRHVYRATGENKLRYNYICARREDLFEAGSATFELPLNDTSSQNIRRVARCALPDRGDSGDVNAEDLLAVFAALNVRTYIRMHIAGREISYFLSNDVKPLLYGRFV